MFKIEGAYKPPMDELDSIAQPVSRTMEQQLLDGMDMNTIIREAVEQANQLLAAER